MAFCPYCGAQIDDGAAFCGSCGAKLGAPEPVRSAPEPEITDSVPAVPEIPEAPAVPVESAEPVVSADPAVYEAPEAPSVTSAPVQAADAAPAQPIYAAAQPAYAQPIYGEQPKKKSRKWLIPVIILAALALIGIAVLVFGGSGRAAANDPNLGLYKGSTASMYGMDLNLDEIFEGGFTIELQKGGKCRIEAGENKGNGTWTLEDGVISINDGTSTIEGKLENGVITLENMLDMGVDITLVKVEE